MICQNCKQEVSPQEETVMDAYDFKDCVKCRAEKAHAIIKKINHAKKTSRQDIKTPLQSRKCSDQRQGRGSVHSMPSVPQEISTGMVNDTEAEVGGVA